jgi:hypothetical protein
LDTAADTPPIMKSKKKPINCAMIVVMLSLIYHSILDIKMSLVQIIHLILTRMSTNVQDELSTTVVDKYTQSFFNKRL